MENETFDIVVVGAGPAGSMAALHAAKAGRKVCLFERKPVVGVPVRCGEGIGLKGMTASIDVNPKWIRTKITKACFVSPSGIKVPVGRMDESYIINREIMEQDLVDMAAKAGAVYRNSTSVNAVKPLNGNWYVCETSGASVKAKCVILAEGIESRLARGLGWKTDLSAEDVETCAFCHVDHESIKGDTVDFYVGSGYAPGGFVWIFPHGKGRANVGLGILGSFHDAGRSKEYLLKFVERFYPDAKISDLHCGGVPVAKWQKPLVRNGVMLVGDAARQVNALSGAGIGYGLYAGRIAGEISAASFTGTECDYKSLKQYEKKWASFYGKQQMRSYSLKKMLMTNNNDKFYDSVAKSFVGANPEKMGYMRIFFRAFAKHPGMLVKVFLLFR
jgi:digeranylgeranylglycerophospholipid reductase